MPYHPAYILAYNVVCKNGLAARLGQLAKLNLKVLSTDSYVCLLLLPILKGGK